MTDARDDFVKYANDLQRINRAALEDPAAFVMRAEKAYDKDIGRVAAGLVRGGTRLVMLAGPTSSGKTTTAGLLAGALEKLGADCTLISLDDFYRGESLAPLLPSGEHDYESIEALDVSAIQECLARLLETSRSEMPVFDFEAHRPFPHRRSVTLKENGIALVEGIHALNPVLIGRLPSLKVKRIYISVKQGIQDGERPLLGPNDMRLIRRIVRDYGFRKTGPERTLGMWGTVMAGERNYIKPFRNLADFTVNSFHVYEPCVLRDQAIRLLHTVSEGSGCFGEARGLLAVLERFRPIDSGLVPRDSILREFIGPAGSVS